MCVCMNRTFFTWGKDVKSAAQAGHMTGAIYSYYSVFVVISCMSGLEQKKKGKEKEKEEKKKREALRGFWLR